MVGAISVRPMPEASFDLGIRGCLMGHGSPLSGDEPPLAALFDPDRDQSRAAGIFMTLDLSLGGNGCAYDGRGSIDSHQDVVMLEGLVLYRARLEKLYQVGLGYNRARGVCNDAIFGVDTVELLSVSCQISRG